MKQFNFFNQNTFTVILFETSFRKHNQEHFHFLFQWLDFAARQEVDWVSQRLDLWVPNAPCPPRRRVVWGFPLVFPFQICQALLAKSGHNPWSKDSVYLRRRVFPEIDNIQV